MTPSPALPADEAHRLAWEVGNVAHLEGASSSTSPYLEGSTEHAAFLRGYHGWPFDSRGGFAA